MRFEYNENLSQKEQSKIVAKEIKDQYPNIDSTAVFMASLLSPPVDDKPTNDEKFERYYYILKNLNPMNEEYLHVFNDLYNVYEDGIETEEYNECMAEIVRYVAKERYTFPDLAEFYN